MKMKKNKMILTVLTGIIVFGVILIYKSYALFSQKQISKSAIMIKIWYTTSLDILPNTNGVYLKEKVKNIWLK